MWGEKSVLEKKTGMLYNKNIKHNVEGYTNVREYDGYNWLCQKR
ncbi:hypothetical protein CLOSTMETH_03249 [[Clostridium] methylpentosum DSM 5476]|uniref:Uncharacterized protein n=1 Tax=[Clostridium] methylpentosum DSM 5476 TaxID=537013 RepID=C0EH49_9FIRM|nr:hypothetical protein CLOSTMETH_03249 [[Clostridium] methylpentosum DSM 5476]